MLLKDVTLKLEVGGSDSVKAGQGKEVRVKLEARDKQTKALTLGLSMDKPKFYTEVVLKPGAAVLIGGPKLEQGVLILAVTVESPGA